MGSRQKDLYPDVTASGGLVRAMKETAKSRGRDIGLPPWDTDVVSIETARGDVSVEAASEERLELCAVLRVGVPGAGWTEMPAGALNACLRTALTVA